jgi:hypothetical protein
MKKILVLTLSLGAFWGQVIRAQQFNDTIQVFAVVSVADEIFGDDGPMYVPDVNPTLMTIELCENRRFLRVYDHGKENMYVTLGFYENPKEPYRDSFVSYDVQNQQPVHWTIDWEHQRIIFFSLNWQYQIAGNWMRIYSFNEKTIRMG